MDKILIRDLLARGVIGVYAWERERPQDILINLTIETDLRPAGQRDALQDGIDYDALTRQVLSHVAEARRFTVEALADDIAAICLKNPNARRVWVRVEKPGAVRFARSVGVEIERSR